MARIVPAALWWEVFAAGQSADTSAGMAIPGRSRRQARNRTLLRM